MQSISIRQNIPLNLTMVHGVAYAQNSPINDTPLFKITLRPYICSFDFNGEQTKTNWRWSESPIKEIIEKNVRRAQIENQMRHRGRSRSCSRSRSRSPLRRSAKRSRSRRSSHSKKKSRRSSRSSERTKRHRR